MTDWNELCAEHPQFVKEPDRHITAEMEKVVDIPCQARGEFVHLCRVCVCERERESVWMC